MFVGANGDAGKLSVVFPPVFAYRLSLPHSPPGDRGRGMVPRTAIIHSHGDAGLSMSLIKRVSRRGASAVKKVLQAVRPPFANYDVTGYITTTLAPPPLSLCRRLHVSCLSDHLQDVA